MMFRGTSLTDRRRHALLPLLACVFVTPLAVRSETAPEPKRDARPEVLRPCTSVGTIERDYGYTPLVVDVKKNDVGFDARRAKWLFRNYPMKQTYRLRVRYGERLRWHGGWISDVRDDAVENDFMCTGTSEDCLIDGTYVFLSTRQKNAAGESPSVITVRRCSIRLEPFAGPHGPERYKRDPGHGMFFKRYPGGPRLVIEDNVFMAEQPGNCPDRNMGVPDGKLVSGKNNVMVWLGKGAYPAKLPSCFTVVKERAAWDKARAAWIRAHPDIRKIDTTPLPRPAP